MIILLHVTLALTSTVLATLLYFRPTVAKLRAAYGLVAATLASGTYLVVSTHANVVHACMSGVLYLAVVSTAIVLSSRKLAHSRIKS